MDGISIGVVVAFAMDLYEHGIITKEQTDGIDLKFGNAEALIAIIHKIGKREGWLGNILAEGVAKAAELIGGDAYKYACHIKGLELPGYDLRTLKTAALGFSVSFRGACHLRNGAYSPDVKGKVNRFKIEKGTRQNDHRREPHVQHNRLTHRLQIQQRHILRRLERPNQLLHPRHRHPNYT